MAATTMATAAGAVVLLYYVLARRLTTDDAKAVEDDEGREYMKSSKSKRRIAQRRPAQAPATWFETISTLSETLRFTYSETLGKWPIGDLAFGINYLLRRQGNVQVASVYAGENSLQLKGPEIIAELKYYLQLLTLCILFSKKPFPVFLESAGYSEADVLLQKPKAGILKPAFTIICDKKSKCFLLLIRGTHSIKDTLTAATGGVVPFHHSVLHDGGISNLILGYAHCGMVAAARWIAKLSIPFLLEALKENPGFEVKIVGHSLGGGTAALLTYILREQKDLSSISCITFAPAACMTWELAESGKHFITTIINGSDLVPTFSTASIDDLRTEVTASSWLNDLRDQVEQTRVLNVVFRSATALGSRLPSIANARAKVAGAGAMLRPVSSSTQVVMKRAQNVAQAVVRTRSTLSAWSCMGARRRAVGITPTEKFSETSLILEKDPDSPSTVTSHPAHEPNMDHGSSSDCSGSGLGHDDTDEEEPLISVDHVTSKSEHITEGELLYELEKELQRQENESHFQAQKEEEAAAQEIIEEEKVIADSVDHEQPISSSDTSENQHLYPPERSARSTFPDLVNFRVAKLNGFRRVFAHVAPIFFERGIAKPETKEISSLSVEPCEGESLIVTVFEINKSEIPSFIEREHEFRFLAVLPETLEGSQYVTPAVLCARYSDEEYFQNRCKGSQEIFHERYGRFGIDKIWRDDVFPCRVYCRHCVLAAKNLGDAVYDNFLDHTYLSDRTTTLRKYLATIGSGIMEEEPPEQLKFRYGG